MEIYMKLHGNMTDGEIQFCNVNWEGKDLKLKQRYNYFPVHFINIIYLLY